jgi:hypothetical protein
MTKFETDEVLATTAFILFLFLGYFQNSDLHKYSQMIFCLLINVGHHNKLHQQREVIAVKNSLLALFERQVELFFLINVSK